MSSSKSIDDVAIEDNGDESLLSSGASTNAIAKTFLKLKDKREAIESGERIARESGLDDKIDYIKKGALLASFPSSILDKEYFTDEEQYQFEESVKRPWLQPFALYLLAATSAMSAAVQGMDESAVGGAQLFYVSVYGIDKDTTYDANIRGIVNAIPYLAASLVGCWISIPSNYFIGRRATIFWSSFLAAASGLWQAFSPSWEMLLVGRLIMGITIGVKSATVPVFTAESTPPSIRGGLVMLWQTLTAFGVMMGFIMGIAFLDLGKHNWRFMLGSVFPLPLVVCGTIFLSPESPRWLLAKGKRKEAYNAFLKLRRNELIAAKDFYYAYVLVELEESFSRGPWYKKYIDIFTIPRNRSAALASAILMFGQQFCGVNVLTFYISTVLVGAGFSNRSALSGSCGFGAIAFCGAVTAIPLIDRKGRRFLVLSTYPFLAVFLFWTAFSFESNDSITKLGLVLTGIYVYVYLYGIGSGPVPFTYNAESGSITVRDAHSSLGTATTWLFCFILGFTLPNMERSMKIQGVFCFYAAWCIVLFFLIYFFVPETKGYTLEELDLIFGIPIKEHASFQLRNGRILLHNLFKKDKLQRESLVDFALASSKGLESEKGSSYS